MLFLLSHDHGVARIIDGEVPPTLNPWSLYAMLKVLDRTNASAKAYEKLFDYYQSFATGPDRGASQLMRDLCLFCVLLASGREDLRELSSSYSLAIICGGAKLRRFAMANPLQYLLVLPADEWLTEVFCQDVEFRGKWDDGTLELRLSSASCQDRVGARLRGYTVDKFRFFLSRADQWVRYDRVRKLIGELAPERANDFHLFVKAGMTPSRLRLPPKNDKV